MLPQPFQPFHSTQSLSVGATSAQFVLGTWETPEGGTLRIVNRSGYDVFVRSGDATVTAAATDIPVLSRTMAMISIKGNHSRVAVISPDGTALVMLSQGRYGHGG